MFDLVVYLVAQRPRAIGRDELIAAVWGRVDGSDATLAQAILKARRLFGDDGSAQRTIRTVARFGYQWVAATEEGDAAPQARMPTRLRPNHCTRGATGSTLPSPAECHWFGAALLAVALAVAWTRHDVATGTPARDATTPASCPT